MGNTWEGKRSDNITNREQILHVHNQPSFPHVGESLGEVIISQKHSLKKQQQANKTNTNAGNPAPSVNSADMLAERIKAPGEVEPTIYKPVSQSRAIRTLLLRREQ